MGMRSASRKNAGLTGVSRGVLSGRSFENVTGVTAVLFGVKTMLTLRKSLPVPRVKSSTDHGRPKFSRTEAEAMGEIRKAIRAEIRDIRESERITEEDLAVRVNAVG